MVTHICFAEKHRTMKPVWCNMQMYLPTKSLNENSQDVRTVVIKNKMFFSCNSCNWTWVWKCLFFFFYQCRAKFKITNILHFFLFKCILHFLIVELHFYYADEFSINCIFSILYKYFVRSANYPSNSWKLLPSKYQGWQLTLLPRE